VGGKIVGANRRQCARVPADRCSESCDDRRSPLHLDLIASLGAKLKTEVPAPIFEPAAWYFHRIPYWHAIRHKNR